MNRLDKLLDIIRGVISGFSLPENISIDENKLSVELSLLKQNQTVEYHDNRIFINADTPEGLAIAKQIMANSEALLNKNERIVESDLGKLIDEAKPYAKPSKEEADLLKDFKSFVPLKDVPIIEAAMFVRRLHQGGANVFRNKQLLIQKYGSRGGNIANLITAGYYEDYLLPIFTYLKDTEGELAEPIFADIYEEAVTQYPFAVFVSESTDIEVIKERIIGKVKLNLINDQHLLNIHGIGRGNKRTILALLSDEDISGFFLSEPDIVELEKTVFVRIYF